MREHTGQIPFLYALPVPRFFSQNHGQGGHVSHVAGILGGFAELGFIAQVLAEESGSPTSRLPDGHVHLLPCRNVSHLPRALWSWRFVRAAAELCRRQHFAFLYVRYSASFAPWLPHLKRACGLPLILEVNSLGSGYHRLLKYFDRRALLDANLLLCVSDTVKAQSEALMGDAAQGALVVPNGVDIERFNRVETIASFREDAAFHIAYAGVLKPDYGLEDLIHAFKLMNRRRSDIILHYFGDGPFRARLEQLAGPRGDIRFHGMVDSESMPAFLKSMDVLVGTTSHRLAFQSPIKLFEYLAAGRPILYADTPQSREVLGDGRCGLLYRTGDADDLAAKLETILAEPGHAQKLGERARLEAAELHTWTQRVRAILRGIESHKLLNDFGSAHLRVASTRLNPQFHL